MGGIGSGGRNKKYATDLERKAAWNEMNKQRQRAKRQKEKERALRVSKAKATLKYVKEEILQYQWDFNNLNENRND